MSPVDRSSLSHAAIVARELGIPAVVGCGNATLRLHTGDRVRVDGGHGTVDVLEKGRDLSGGVVQRLLDLRDRKGSPAAGRVGWLTAQRCRAGCRARAG